MLRVQTKQAPTFQIYKLKKWMRKSGKSNTFLKKKSNPLTTTIHVSWPIISTKELWWRWIIKTIKGNNIFKNWIIIRSSKIIMIGRWNNSWIILTGIWSARVNYLIIMKNKQRKTVRKRYRKCIRQFGRSRRSFKMIKIN